jgi:hypothetical protein
MSRAGKPGQDAPESPGDFLMRWSRRKIEARDGAVSPADTDAVSAPPPGAEADARQASEQEQVLTDADMPPLETLNSESDFAPFMSPGVSDDLRQQALRILFRQPAYNITDGLNDYDGDFTQFVGLGGVVTQEMKRMLKRELDAEINRQTHADQAKEARTAGAGVPAPVDAPEQSQTAATGQLDTDADDAADKG